MQGRKLIKINFVKKTVGHNFTPLSELNHRYRLKQWNGKFLYTVRFASTPYLAKQWKWLSWLKVGKIIGFFTNGHQLSRSMVHSDPRSNPMLTHTQTSSWWDGSTTNDPVSLIANPKWAWEISLLTHSLLTTNKMHFGNLYFFSDNFLTSARLKKIIWPFIFHFQLSLQLQNRNGKSAIFTL